MKLVRYGRPGQEKPGLIDAQGQLRSLVGVIEDVSPQNLSDTMIRRLSKIDTNKLPVVRGKQRMGCPIAGTRKFVAIGLNYKEHAAESGLPLPKEPIIFFKAITSLQGPNDNVMLPRGSKMRLGTRARCGDWQTRSLCFAKERPRTCCGLLHRE